MITQRSPLYDTVLVKNNKEFDLLGTNIKESVIKDTQINFVVSQQYIGRIDQISFDMYGTVDLWWLICQENDIINPIDELVLGQNLKIPAIDEYYDFYQENSKIDSIDESFDRREIK